MKKADVIKIIKESVPSIEEANVQEQYLLIFNTQSEEQLGVTIYKDGCYLYVDDEFDSSYDGLTTESDFEIVMFRICQYKEAFDAAMQAINEFVVGGDK